MRPARAAVGIIVMAGLLAILARTSGSGWLVVIASGLVPLLVIGSVAPVIPLVRARARVALPPDGMVGRAASIAVTVEGRARGLTLRLHDPASGWVQVDAPANGTVLAVPKHRGVIDTVRVELSCAAPFGFVAWKRVVEVPCERPFEVAPVPIVGRAPLTDGDHRAEPGDDPGARHGGEMIRGIRPYAAGDAFRLVHWPATARWGDVMVRELDDDVPPRLVLVVDLRDEAGSVENVDVAAAEEVASRAAGLAGDALAAGRHVLLATAEPSGPVSAVVETVTDAGRRLARAVAGPPASPARQPGDVVVRLEVPFDRRGDNQRVDGGS